MVNYNKGTTLCKRVTYLVIFPVNWISNQFPHSDQVFTKAIEALFNGFSLYIGLTLSVNRPSLINHHIPDTIIRP